MNAYIKETEIKNEKTFQTATICVKKVSKKNDECALLVYVQGEVVVILRGTKCECENEFAPACQWAKKVIGIN